jgi:hypothetical protein
VRDDYAIGAMKQTYVESDFERAAAIVAADPSPVELVQRLGIDWEFLSWLGIGLAAELVPEGAVTAGAEAFNAGFLIGAYMRRGGLDIAVSEEETRLGWAVEAVRERGRHAVIADYCDLAAVARIETAYAEALAETLELPDKRLLRDGITRLFESGLATGLVLSDVDVT